MTLSGRDGPRLHILFGTVSPLLLRPPLGGWLLGGHLVALGVVEPVRRRGPPASSAWRAVRALYPLLTLPALYHVAGRLNVGLSHWVLSQPMERLEAALFRGQPSLYLAELLPSVMLSEALHLWYFSYSTSSCSCCR